MGLPVADVGAPILAVFGATVTLQRRAAGTMNNGRYTHGALTTSSIVAAVQPASASDLLKLPEGERTEETVAVFTRDALVESSAGNGLESDHIVWQGRTYRVRLVEDWTPQALYAYALAVRVTP